MSIPADCPYNPQKCSGVSRAIHAARRAERLCMLSRTRVGRKCSLRSAMAGMRFPSTFAMSVPQAVPDSLRSTLHAPAQAARDLGPQA